jgi:hypothetical protein
MRLTLTAQGFLLSQRKNKPLISNIRVVFIQQIYLICWHNLYFYIKYKILTYEKIHCIYFYDELCG